MTAPLLETKLRLPRPRSGTIPRPRLEARLNHGAELPLTLISAPAGFGKTTVLAAWLADVQADGRLVAWLSLDARDNEPSSFWRYIATALRVAGSDVSKAALSMLESPSIPIESAISSLINDLDDVPHDVILVLDDFHLIDSPGIQEGIQFWLENAPLQIHLVIASRADPGLPLAQMRARGELIELRAADLRFTANEASDYLNNSMGLDLNGSDIDILEERTEGWIAALQLAALSMQGRDDASSFIAGFAGDDRYIVDYLAEEVLLRQPAEVRQFLLDTSILERMCGSLCDALTGQVTGKTTLVSLDRRNLFLVPLDDRRQWYRYHHLFAEVLRTHLLDEQPQRLPELHLSASRWFEDAGDHTEAIRHALAAPDFERAAHLLELACATMQQERQEVALRDSIAALPAEIVRVRPVLSNAYAGALLSTGQFDLVEEHLANAEQHLSTPRAKRTEIVISDEQQFAQLAAAVAVHRAGFSLVSGDVLGCVAHARHALELATPDDHISKAASTALIGLAAWSSGDLVVAEQAYEESLGDMAKAGHFTDVLGLCIALADIQIALGHLQRAASTCTQALALSAEQSADPLRGSADMLIGLSEVSAELGEYAAAANYLTQAEELGEVKGLPQYPYRRRLARARLLEMEGRFEEAVTELEHAKRVFNSDFSPVVRPIPAVIARTQLKMGNLREPLAWARDAGIAASAELSYVREFELITYLRVLVAQFESDQGQQHLRSFTSLHTVLLVAARAGQRTRAVIELQVLAARAANLTSDLPTALACLDEAIQLAEPGGYLHVLLNEGPSIQPLLAKLNRQHGDPAFLKHALAVGAAPQPRYAEFPVLVDPLSARELDVLRLLATDRDGPDIARHLFISVNTLRTHTKNIYAKLGTTNRRATVTRAQELKLLK